MEEHFLKEFVSGPSGITPEPWFNPEGDCIIYQTSDEPFVADRIDEVLTLYRSLENNAVIGYQIKGVNAILHIFDFDTLTVACDHDGREISLVAMLLAAYDKGPKTIGRRQAYTDAFESVPKRQQIRFIGPVSEPT
jgi:hypothetical protein